MNEGDDSREEELEEVPQPPIIKPSEELIDLAGINSTFETGDVLYLNKLKKRLEATIMRSMTQSTVDMY